MNGIIKTEAPKHDEKVLAALEKTLASHDLRLTPGQDLSTVADAIVGKGFALSAPHGFLEAEQTTAGNTAPVHVSRLIEGLATQEPTRFFPRDPSGVAGKDQLDLKGRVKFLKTHSLAEWEALPLKAPTERTVVLDKSKMTREQWSSLDLKTKTQLSGQWGSRVVGEIMNRRSAKK
ncbi:MAG TPA: hypothetical protein VMS18_20115 [Candidatus Binatia bacterium]|nr:hypothetical protein [Candidatus Binatia bacterium]